LADNLKITFPKATLVYPALQRPDTKYGAEGTYKADIRLSKAEAQPFIDRIQERAKAHIGKKVKPGQKAFYKIETDEDGNPTGNILFNIRVKNRISKKDGKLWDRRPLLIDAKKLPVDVNPWGGTVARVQAEIYEYTYQGEKGLSLQPVVVQIIDLVTGQGREAPDTDDFDEEDGYAGTSADTSSFDDESSTDDSSSDDADY
jgi:hypothetical protein